MKESQLENKTAIATNDYMRMVDENGNSVKIKKDSFMAAIRDALPSIISDGETGGGSVLSIINGALKSRTDANLASVLGVKHFLKKISNNETLVISNAGYGFLIVSDMATGGISIYIVYNEGVILVANKWNDGDTRFTVSKSSTENTITITRVNGNAYISVTYIPTPF